MTTTYKTTETFEANGKQWKTDADTLQLMREFRDDDNKYMVSVVFYLAKSVGRVVEAN